MNLKKYVTRATLAMTLLGTGCSNDDLCGDLDAKYKAFKVEAIYNRDDVKREFVSVYGCRNEAGEVRRVEILSTRSTEPIGIIEEGQDAQRLVDKVIDNFINNIERHGQEEKTTKSYGIKRSGAHRR